MADSKRVSPIYINSADRLFGTPADFHIHLADIAQNFPRAQVSVTSVQIPFSFFSVNALNNSFVISESTPATFTVTLVPGNYTGAQMAAEMATQINAAAGNTYTVTFAVIQGQFTITRTVGALTFSIDGAAAGFTAEVATGYVLTTGLSATAKVSDNVINLTAPDVIYVIFDNFRKGFNTRDSQESNIMIAVPNNVNAFNVIEHNPSIKFQYDMSFFLTDVNIRLETPAGEVLDLNGQNWTIQLQIDQEK